MESKKKGKRNKIVSAVISRQELTLQKSFVEI